MNDTLLIDETRLNDFASGYTNLFARHCAKQFNWAEDFAKRVIGDALRFLTVSAIPSGILGTSTKARVMVSSPIIDQVVDTILLDTPLLMWLEREVFHSRMVHVPAYAHGVTDQAINNARYHMTIMLMEAAGYILDPQIWPPRLPEGYLPCSGGNDLEDCSVMFIPLQGEPR